MESVESWEMEGQKVKIGEESERRVTATVCRLRWEGTPARNRLARRTVRLQRAHTAVCAQMAMPFLGQCAPLAVCLHPIATGHVFILCYY